MKKLAVFIVTLLVAMGAVYALFAWRERREESPQRAVMDLPVSVPRDGALEQEEKRKVVIFYPSSEHRYLRPEERLLMPPEKPEELVSLIVKQLVKGASNDGGGTIPEGTELRGVFFDGQETVYLDFTPQLKQKHIPGAWAEALTVYSIVNTVIVNIEGLKRVHILVDGSEVETLGGHLALDQPFGARPEMVKGSAR